MAVYSAAAEARRKAEKEAARVAALKPLIYLRDNEPSSELCMVVKYEAALRRLVKGV